MNKKIKIENLRALHAKKILNPQKEKIAKEKKIWRDNNPF